MHECTVHQLCLQNKSGRMSATLVCIVSADLYQRCPPASVTQQLLLPWNLCVATVGCELGAIPQHRSTTLLCAYFCVCM